LGEQAAGSGSQHLGQGVVNLTRLTQPDDSGRTLHGVSLSLRGSGRLDTRLDTPPLLPRRHPIFRIAPKYRALTQAGKPAKVAITAIMRKLIVLANALLRGERKWSPHLA